MEYREKLAGLRTRIAIAILIWAVLGPLFIALRFWANWAFAFFLVFGLWITYDYVRRGAAGDAPDRILAGDEMRVWGYDPDENA